IALAQTVATAEHVPTAILLGGDDGDPEVVQRLTFTIVSLPSHGTLTGFNPTTGQVIYVPAVNYSGADAFSFVVSDDGTAGGPPKMSAPATVSIAVTPVNDLPVAFAQAASVPEHGSVLLTLTGKDGDPEV